MLHPNAISASATYSGMDDADEIEQRLIRAYVQLACTTRDKDGSRAVTFARFGGLEARLTEVPVKHEGGGMPLFWLEIYSHACRTTIGSCGCTEFDESELAAAVELITNARQRFQDAH